MSERIKRWQNLSILNDITIAINEVVNELNVMNKLKIQVSQIYFLERKENTCINSMHRIENRMRILDEAIRRELRRIPIRQKTQGIQNRVQKVILDEIRGGI